MDMKAALDAKRKERLAKAGPQPSGSLIPKKVVKREEKPVEPPPPSIELIVSAGKLPIADAQVLRTLCDDHAIVGARMREDEKIKDALTKKIKAIIEGKEDAYKMMVDDCRMEYYPVGRTSFTAESLLGAGVAPDVIAKAGTTKVSWTLKIRREGDSE